MSTVTHPRWGGAYPREADKLPACWLCEEHNLESAMERDCHICEACFLEAIPDKDVALARMYAAVQSVDVDPVTLWDRWLVAWDTFCERWMRRRMMR